MIRQFVTKFLYGLPTHIKQKTPLERSLVANDRSLCKLHSLIGVETGFDLPIKPVTTYPPNIAG